MIIDVTKKMIEKAWQDCFNKYLDTKDFQYRKNIKDNDYKDYQKFIKDENTFIHFFGLGVCILEKIINVEENNLEEALDVLTAYEYSSYNINDNKDLVQSLNALFDTLLYKNDNRIIKVNKNLKMISTRKRNNLDDYFLSYSLFIMVHKNRSKKILTYLLKNYELKRIVENTTHDIYAGWYINLAICNNKNDAEDVYAYFKFQAKYFFYLYGLCYFLYNNVSKLNIQLVHNDVKSKNKKNLNYKNLKKTKSFLQLIYSTTNYNAAITNEDILKIYQYYEKYVNSKNQREEMLSTLNSLTNTIQTQNEERTSSMTTALTIIGAIFAGVSTIAAFDEVYLILKNIFR